LRPNRWGIGENMNHMSRITVELKADRVPFEMHEVVALAAPTPAFYWSGQEDTAFPHWQRISEGMLELKTLYRFLGHEEKFEFLLGTVGHFFPRHIREISYSFLDRWLLHVK
jgi:hypothetical protein